MNIDEMTRFFGSYGLKLRYRWDETLSPPVLFIKVDGESGDWQRLFLLLKEEAKEDEAGHTVQEKGIRSGSADRSLCARCDLFRKSLDKLRSEGRGTPHG